MALYIQPPTNQPTASNYQPTNRHPGRPLRLLSPDDPLKDATYIAVAALAGGRDGRNDILQLGGWDVGCLGGCWGVSTGLFGKSGAMALHLSESHRNCNPDHHRQPTKPHPAPPGAPLSLNAIRTHLASEIRTVENVFWAPAGKQVLARKQTRLGSLVLSEEAAVVGDEKALPVLFKVGLGLRTR